jgi:hypothetical protein
VPSGVPRSHGRGRKSNLIKSPLDGISDVVWAVHLRSSRTSRSRGREPPVVTLFSHQSRASRDHLTSIILRSRRRVPLTPRLSSLCLDDRASEEGGKSGCRYGTKPSRRPFLSATNVGFGCTRRPNLGCAFWRRDQLLGHIRQDAVAEVVESTWPVPQRQRSASVEPPPVHHPALCRATARGLQLVLS